MLVAFTIVLIHWIADFIFQAEEWANNKSKNMKALLSHTLTYSLVSAVLWMIAFPSHITFPDVFIKTQGHINIVSFFLITFAAHTVTDYFTSRVVSKKFAAGKYGSPIPNFGAFSIIGLDQVLHYGQLFLTFYILI